MKKVLLIGGLCGMTMLRAASMIEDECRDRDISISVKIQNVWESPTVEMQGLDVVIQMMPLYETAPCMLVSGKPFISHFKEKQLLSSIIDYLERGGERS
ncbi:hypothetical protein SANA_06830 [Gottschalkiaceae bacterium SANA]|nr:hypothetical protein SANA_06830 [Gottschalkiaceae bacterium SANA]